ncbi:hypothetical protein RW092_02875 [Paenibacillus sp. 3LSP]|uniref:hypothetical protein n=1 Tax=Paenibacillus sp. 3LSP TaxID=2800795 RepID=UPI0028FD7185|nr:hypothetical protein [Paenibacillus sp. 3LSP]MDU0329146.1 hypothetical protein [Paenibacillus sp. 3LSP]
MNLRILKEGDAQVYQSLRLQGLQEYPDAFGSTFEREVAWSEYDHPCISQRIGG